MINPANETAQKAIEEKFDGIVKAAIAGMREKRKPRFTAGSPL